MGGLLLPAAAIFLLSSVAVLGATQRFDPMRDDPLPSPEFFPALSSQSTYKLTALSAITPVDLDRELTLDLRRNDREGEEGERVSDFANRPGPMTPLLGQRLGIPWLRYGREKKRAYAAKTGRRRLVITDTTNTSSGQTAQGSAADAETAGNLAFDGPHDPGLGKHGNLLKLVNQAARGFGK